MLPGASLKLSAIAFLCIPDMNSIIMLGDAPAFLDERAPPPLRPPAGVDGRAPWTSVDTTYEVARV